MANAESGNKTASADAAAGEARGAAIEALYAETRVFPPPPAFATRAVVRDQAMYERALEEPEGFWAEQATSLDWFKPHDKVLTWEPPYAKWFEGGQLNVSYNCLDRHVAAGRGAKIAYYYEGEPGDARTITYAELLREVGKCANALKE